MPKPVTRSAVQPLIPTTIINSLFLYRKIFRRETFRKNPRRFHKKGIRSSRTLFPALGALGRIRAAATCFSSARQESQVVPREHSSDTVMEISAIFPSKI